VNARSALFDLYGDHLRRRGGRAPVAALVRLAAPLGISAPAVRTAVSRMVRQGWLEPVRLPAGPGYALTPRASQWLDEAALRVYARADRPWDGQWHLVVLARVPDRARRDRVRAALAYLGYAPVGAGTWVSPRPAAGLATLLATECVAAEQFRASYDGDARGLLSRAWDLDALALAYQQWLRWAAGVVAGTGPGTPDETVFARRSILVHEWRKFLFSDPGLPAALLPPRWPGRRAAGFFHAEAARLLPGASRFVDCCLRHPDVPAPPG
jgi:phenylacetic acid degradation operon negative regulatory protein